MAWMFSPQTGGFYLTERHGDRIPRDAIAISDAEYQDMMRRQAEGAMIVVQHGRPVAVAQPEPQGKRPLVMDALEFRNRFTREEKARMTLAASQALDAGDATLQVFIDDLNSSGTVHLDHPEIVAGVEFLLRRNLITPRRADEILGR